MNIYFIIQQFSTEESALFKKYMRQKNKRTDVKNLELYAYLRKNTSLEKIDVLLYGKPNRNAYHALSKRLQDLLIDFIAIRNFGTETSEDMQVFKWILASRILYEQDLPKEAQKILKKATKKAQELDLYTALVESYHTQLQYNYLHSEIDLLQLTQEAQENQRRFIQQENINMAYAHIKRALIFDDALLKKGIQKTVEEIFTSFKIEFDAFFTFKSLYQLLAIINTAAHLDHNFSTALPFITDVFQRLQKKSAPQNRQRVFYIQILYFMANAHFRVRKFELATNYLNQMTVEMLAEKGKYQKRFQDQVLLINSLILNYTGQTQLAISDIEKQITLLKKQNADPDLVLAYVVFLMQQEDFKKALSALNTLGRSDAWYEKHMGNDWIIKRELLSLIMYYELEYTELVHSRLRRFKRKFEPIIGTEIRLEGFIKVFSQIFNDPPILKEIQFQESVKNQFTSTSLQNEDIFMLSFFAWIKSKINNTPLYETTLGLL